MSSKNLLKDKAITLRRAGKTYSEIRAEVPVAKSTLSLWLREVGLSVPQQQTITDKSIQARLRGAEARRSNRKIEQSRLLLEGEAEIGRISERELFLIGVSLYWGEGSKQKEHTPSEQVVFCNTDYRMIKVFMAWLDLLGIPDEERVCDLYIHETRINEIQYFKNWWLEKVGIAIPVERIYKKKGNPKTNRHNKYDLYHGLFRIKVRSSTTLNRRTAGWISGVALQTDLLRDRLMAGHLPLEEGI